MKIFLFIFFFIQNKLHQHSSFFLYFALASNSTSTYEKRVIQQTISLIKVYTHTESVLYECIKCERNSQVYSELRVVQVSEKEYQFVGSSRAHDKM